MILFITKELLETPKNRMKTKLLSDRDIVHDPQVFLQTRALVVVLLDKHCNGMLLFNEETHQVKWVLLPS